MASANQIKALLESHLKGDEERFFSIALQVAAHEAKIGHGKLAKELRDLVLKTKESRTSAVQKDTLVPISKLQGGASDLLQVSNPKQRLKDLIVDTSVTSRLKRVIREQKHFAKLRNHGLHPRHKILLTGPPGTGKTLTASVLAGELGLPLFTVRLDSIITKFMGETAVKLRQIFDSIAKVRGVYFFDEFDALGSQRGLANDVGEARRILNSFLVLIEQDNSTSLILAATNHPDILDLALFRRFDDVIQYSHPNDELIQKLLRARLAQYVSKQFNWESVTVAARGLSAADISKSSLEAIKEMLIEGRETISQHAVIAALEELRESNPA